MSKPGIVILGTPRSGTTLLRRILNAHPNIACPPETYLLSAAARFLHDDSFAAGLKIGVEAGLAFAGFSQTEILDRLRSFSLGFFEDYAKRENKARWAEKTAFDAFYLPKIRSLLSGHVSFVGIHRHGLDVVCSLADLVEKTGGYVEELHRYLRRYPQPYEAFAHAWVDTANQVEDLVQEEEQAFGLRYEDLISNPKQTLEGLLGFLDEPWEDGLIEAGLESKSQVGFGDWKTYSKTQVDNSSVERWRKLPTPTIAMLAEICNPTLERLGYSKVKVAGRSVDDGDEEAARRRYELGLLVNRMRAEKKTTE